MLILVVLLSYYMIYNCMYHLGRNIVRNDLWKFQLREWSTHSPGKKCFSPLQNHSFDGSRDAGSAREQILHFLLRAELELTALEASCDVLWASTGVVCTYTEVGRRHMINDLLFHPPTLWLYAYSSGSVAPFWRGFKVVHRCNTGWK